MKERSLNWDDVPVFLAVARAGSLSAAAQTLGLGLATVSRRIERLETRLGYPLFLRHHAGYRLTEDGAALVGHGEAMEAAARALAPGARNGQDVTGTVRLATAENLATELILPSLPQVSQAHPGLLLEVLTDVFTVNLHRHEADLALRMVRPERGNVSVQRLGTLGYGLYGAPDRFPDGRFDPDRDPLIAWADGYGHLPAAEWIRRALRGRTPALATTSLATQVAGCVSGIGAALLPHLVAHPRRLLRLGPDPGIEQAIWLVTHADLASTRRVRAVATFLRRLVADNRGRLEGT